ncbi:hypothetical protein [Vibrio crassostreae]|uniref:hypothetical protein n=1 Tax=Vibrio crassostreae TaxID=246167 RepID=UPI001B30579B|nr:hypothetical protein [Vibrio crassostreae]
MKNSNKIIIITDEQGRFHQHRNIHKTLDIDKIRRFFVDKDYIVEVITYNEISNKLGSYNGCIFFGTSSYDLKYKKFLSEIIFELGKNNKVVPAYEHFNAHENKLYQEVYKKRIGLNSIENIISCNLDDRVIDLIESEVGYPLIFKLDSGAGGSTVYKVNNVADLISLYNSFPIDNGSLRTRIKNKIKKVINEVFGKQYVMSFDPEFSDTKTFVAQKMISNLDHDWKVLIFGKKLFALRRNIPSDDFRASGQGLLDFDTQPPNEVLKFAFDVYRKLNTPHVSLDIACDKREKCYLIEYQVCAFGPTTMLDSKYVYQFEREGVFSRNINDDSLEETYASSVIDYINNES